MATEKIERTSEALANSGKGGWTPINTVVFNAVDVQKPVLFILNEYRNIPNATVTIYNGLSGLDARRWTYRRVRL